MFQHQIIDGKRTSEVCAVKMVQELDAGPVYMRQSMPLLGSMLQIFEHFAFLTHRMMDKIIATDPTPIPQEGEPTVYLRRKPEESVINPDFNLLQTYNHIRALDAPGYPKAFIEYGGLRIEFDTAVNAYKNVVLANVRITKR